MFQPRCQSLPIRVGLPFFMSGLSQADPPQCGPGCPGDLAKQRDPYSTKPPEGAVSKSRVGVGVAFEGTRSGGVPNEPKSAEANVPGRARNWRSTWATSPPGPLKQTPSAPVAVALACFSESGVAGGPWCKGGS